MAEKLCELRKKGGGGGEYSETSLWTNPSSSSTFAAQTITLSESMDNYKYVKIRYAFSTSAQADVNCGDIIIPVEDFKKSSESGSANALISLGGTSSTTRYTRYSFYASATTIKFGSCVQFGSSTSNNNATIPLKILGLNELDHGTALSSFSITGASYASSYYHTSAATTDSSLMAVSASNSQTSSYTVLRNAKGKVYFNYGMRGTVSTYGTIKIGGTTYRPDQYRSSAQTGIEVELSANDTITVTCGISTYCYEVSMWFVEEQ